MRVARRASRFLFLHALWSLILAVLVGRLFVLMVLPTLPAGERVHASSARWQMDSEHFATKMVSDGRGRILFRNGEPWSQTSVIDHGRVVVKPVEIAPEILGDIGIPDAWPDGREVVPEVGRDGLEWSLEPLLRSRRPQLVGHLQMVNGTSASADTEYQLHAVPGDTVVTTVDRNAQVQAETILRRHALKHASIVSIDLPSYDIRVLASADHRQSDALTAVTPGSVFKLVVAAAALETHSYTTMARFFCDGHVHFPHVRMNCWKSHGSISFRQALSESCDTTFAQMGIRLGRHAIAVVASRFGLTDAGISAVQHRVLVPGVQTGHVYRQAGVDAGLLANTAIGQEDVRITPLEGALMAAAIAEDGGYQHGRLIQSIHNASGKSLSLLTEQKSRACSGYTAHVLQSAMWDAVHTPTGTAYALHDLPIGAKTGTAELPNGNVNVWLVGFRVKQGKPTEAFAITLVNVDPNTAHQRLYSVARRYFHRDRDGDVRLQG